MTTQEFIQKSEFVYHLTAQENLVSILASGKLLSAKEIVRQSDLSKKEKEAIINERRPEHVAVVINGVTCYLRDQRPISIKALAKCLTDDLTTGDFLESLNSRVFFWPTLKRLQVHFSRYQHEKPRIIRARTEDIFAVNANALRFCHLNSGATRCHPKWHGAPPPRGKNTFVRASEFEFKPTQVAEVTFLSGCTLPDKIQIGNSPEGPWRSI